MIAYARTTGITSDATSEIRVVDAATGESDMPIHVVTGNSVELSSPTRSPDGRRIAFLRRDASTGVAPDTFPPLPRTGIWIADADGSNARQVAVATDAQHIDWKPDGSSLLISGSGPAGGRASVLRLSDGTLSEVGANARLATWSADGESVYSYAEVGGRWRLAKGRITDRSLQRTGYVPGIENTFIYDSFGIATRPGTS